MTVASKNQFNWENTYATDGLVAMWDGEQNAGQGNHVDNALEWVDLVSGRKSNPVAAYDAQFTNNALHIPASSRSFADPDMISPFGSFSTITWEICFNSIATYPANIYGNGLFMFGPIANSGNSILFGRSANAGRISINMYGYIDHVVRLSEAKNTDSVRCTLACRFDDSDVLHTYNAFMNGVKRLQWGHAHNPRSELPSFRLNVPTLNEIDIYCIRVYDRMLSDKDIANNYNEDKKRFNLT